MLTPNTSQEPCPAQLGGSAKKPERLLTLPNVLTAIRLVAAPWLVFLAWQNQPLACMVLALTLQLTDWLDGTLARRWKMQTVFGARLDSLADATFYGSLMLSIVVLRGEVIRRENAWIVVALASYVANVAVGWLKFRCVPCYHTRLAKTSWLLMLIAIPFTFADLSEWPLRIALSAVTLTNLEEIAITCLLLEWRPDVPSLFQALQARTTPREGEPC